MATQNLQYDHPSYIAVQNQPFQVTAGSGTTYRFALFADAIAKSLVMKPVVAATSADTFTAIVVSNTSTRTLGVGTVASAQTTFVRVELTTASRTCLQGDEVRIVKGTDATVVYAGAVELVTTPGATLTS